MGKVENEPKLFNLADEMLFHGLKEMLDKMLDQVFDEDCLSYLSYSFHFLVLT